MDREADEGFPQALHGATVVAGLAAPEAAEQAVVAFVHGLVPGRLRQRPLDTLCLGPSVAAGLGFEIGYVPDCAWAAVDTASSIAPALLAAAAAAAAAVGAAAVVAVVAVAAVVVSGAGMGTAVQAGLYQARVAGRRAMDMRSVRRDAAV